MNKIKTYFKNCSSDNLYSLEGIVPFFKAIPISLEHAFAMLISNITPILLILTNPLINSDPSIVKMGIQNSLLLAGVGSILQFFPIWKVGSRLPLFVGMNFAFMSIINYIGIAYGYNVIASSVIVGSIFFIIISLFLKKVLRFIPPISSSIVVFMLGLSLIISQIKTIPFTDKSFYTVSNLVVILITILSYVIASFGFKRKLQSMSLIISLFMGFVTAVIFKMVDFNPIETTDIVTYPHLIKICEMELNVNAIITVCIMFLVSITDAVGAIELLDITNDSGEKASYIAKASLGMGVISFFSGFLGCIPLTTFAQNTGIVKKTKVINRYVLLLGAILLIVLSFFPMVSAFILTIPSIIISVIAIMIFVSILMSGVNLLKHISPNYKNIIIISCSIGVSLTIVLVPNLFNSAPKLIESLFTNSIATSFIISVILYYIIPNPKEKKVKK